jgi:hypothetical protein
MTGNRDRYGEPIEDNDTAGPAVGLPGFPTFDRNPDEILAHCAALRRVLAEARARREAQQ